MSRGAVGAWPLVGRGTELDAVATAIGRADVSGVVLAGHAGVGKTRLGTECLAIAKRAGFATARAMATGAAATIPLGALAPLLPYEVRPQARANALQGAARALAARATDRPFMLLVDDAHLLDPASAAVLHQLALGREVFVVVTVRVGEMTPDPVASLWKDDLALRVDLSPLAKEEVDDLLRQVLGDEVEGATRSLLFRLSEGNPLFLRELVVGALDAELLTRVDGVWSLRARVVASPRLVELVEARVTGLTDGQRRALEFVVFAEPIGLDLLLAITDADALETLERLNLVSVSLDDGQRLVRLAHPLHGEILRSQMPRLRAMAVQRRLAETFASAGELRPDDALRVAVWSLEAGAHVDAAVLLAAARQAHIAHDANLAERLAREAHQATGGSGAAQLLGEVLSHVGRHREAVDVLADGLSRATSDEDLALIAMTLTDSLYWGLGLEQDARAVLDEVAPRLSDSSWDGEIRGLRASLDLLDGRPLDALAAVEPLLTSAHGRAFVQAGTVAGPALAMTGQCERAIEVADAAFAAHVELGEMAIMASAGTHLVAQAFALIESGRIAEAVSLSQTGYDAAITSHARDGQAWFGLLLGRAQWLSRPAAAAAAFREAAAVFLELGLDVYREWCLGGAAMADAQRGEIDAATALVDTLDGLRSRSAGMMRSDVLRARGWTAVACGDLAGGRTRFEEAAALARSRGMAPLESAALHDLVRLGNADSSDRLAELASVVDGALATTRAAHATALVRNDTAGLGEASDGFARIGVDVLAAESAAQASASHQRRGESRAAAQWAQRAASLVAATGGLSTPALGETGTAASLTRRELEVARLAATGLSNKDIGEELFLSVRTVGNHLQRAYEKLGVRGRDDLGGVLGAGPAGPRPKRN